MPILRSRAPVDIMKSVWDRQKQMDTSREQPHAYTLRGAHYGTSSNTETTGASKGPDSADDPQHKLNGTGSLTAGTSRALLAGKTPAQSHSVAAPASSSVLVVPENASHSMTSEFRQRLIAGARFKVKGTKPTFISLWCNSNLSSLQWRLSGSSSGQPDGVLLLSSIVKVIPLRRKDSNNWLSIVSIDKTMTVEAPCREERDAWVQSLNVAANLPA